MKRIIAVCAAISGVVSLASVRAETGGDAVRTEIVRYADLDLSNSHGRHVLQLRLRHAVDAVCGGASSADLRALNEARRCRATLLNRLSGVRQRLTGADMARQAIMLKYQIAQARP